MFTKKPESPATPTGSAVVATPPAPAGALVDQKLAALFLEDTGRGFESMSKQDYALPFIKLLQQLSPEVTKGDAQFIPEAEAGDFVNSVTGELYKGEKGIIAVPVAFERVYIEWRPRKLGGGFVANYKTKEEAAAKSKPWAKPGQFDKDVDNLVAETAQHYCLVFSPTLGWVPAVFAMTSTKLKASRVWNTLAAQTKVPGTNRQLPLFGAAYRITSKLTKKQDNSFYVPEVAQMKILDNVEDYAAAKEFGKTVSEGAAKVDYTKAEHIVDADVEVVAQGPIGKTEEY
jgi:hypothetical protein